MKSAVIEFVPFSIHAELSAEIDSHLRVVFHDGSESVVIYSDEQSRERAKNALLGAGVSFTEV